MPTPEFLRTESDTHLSQKLLDSYDVRKSIEEVERDSENLRIRRQLMATAIHLSRRLAPDLHAIVDECVERLGVEEHIEPYVYADARCNAGVARPEEDRVFIMFSSEILDAFDHAELKFVVGHELGHHVFGHHGIPVGSIIKAGQGITPDVALELFSWSRFAEVSADRAGLYCAGELEAVGRGLFKLASGLRGTKTNLAVDALLAQVAELEKAGKPMADDIDTGDWLSTHPFSPLRLKAAHLFAGSEAMKTGGKSIEELELEINDLMGLMGPGYLKDQTDQGRAMRRLLLAGGILVADAHDGISDDEIAALEKFLGEGTVTRHLSADALREDLPIRARDLNELAPKARRAQVVRDLCVIALADGHAHPQERAVILDIARHLQIGEDIVTRTLDASLELD